MTEFFATGTPNSGPVVPPQEVDRLFGPFQRLGNGRTQASAGHGLVLAIVRAIADAHGGSVTAEARQDGGLDIAVTFPAGECRRRSVRARAALIAAGSVLFVADHIVGA